MVAYRREQCYVFGWVEAMNLERSPFVGAVEPMVLMVHVVDGHQLAVEHMIIAELFEQVSWGY